MLAPPTRRKYSFSLRAWQIKHIRSVRSLLLILIVMRHELHTTGYLLSVVFVVLRITLLMRFNRCLSFLTTNLNADSSTISVPHIPESELTS